MAKKIILLTLIILALGSVALAAKKSASVPESERIKIAVEVVDSTNFIELDTAQILRDAVILQLKARKLFNIVNAEENLTAVKSLGSKRGASEVGEMLMFNPVTMTDGNVEAPFDKNLYKKLGARYVIRCDILGLGTTGDFYDSYDLEPHVGIGIGTGGSFGFGVFGGVPGTKRSVFGTVVSMQFLDAATGKLLFRHNLVGQELQRRKPSKGYDDASDEAYLKSIQDAAKIITRRVENYARKNLLKGN